MKDTFSMTLVALAIPTFFNLLKKLKVLKATMESQECMSGLSIRLGPLLHGTKIGKYRIFSRFLMKKISSYSALIFLLTFFSEGFAQSDEVRRFSKEWKKRGPEKIGILLSTNIFTSGAIVCSKKDRQIIISCLEDKRLFEWK